MKEIQPTLKAFNSSLFTLLGMHCIDWSGLLITGPIMRNFVPADS